MKLHSSLLAAAAVTVSAASSSWSRTLRGRRQPLGRRFEELRAKRGGGDPGRRQGGQPKKHQTLSLRQQQEEEDVNSDARVDGALGSFGVPPVAEEDLEQQQDDSDDNEKDSANCKFLAIRMANMYDVPELVPLLRHRNAADEVLSWTNAEHHAKWLKLTRKNGNISKNPECDLAQTAILSNASLESLSWSFALGACLPVAHQFVRALSSTVWGMGRLLLSMGLVQQAFLQVYTVVQDWYTGRYIRQTLQHVERQYNRQYQVPAIFRSAGRLLVHMAVLFVIGEWMENMVGLGHAPCHMSKEGGGCHWWCGFLWLLASTGTGHSAGVAIAIWGRGLRIQIESPAGRPSGRRILRRPWLLARWIYDPGKWFREVLARDRRDPSRHALQPFDPDWRLFPATWRIVRILQLAAVAKEMWGSDAIMHDFMRLVLIQQALGDEWFRVLMCEKRVALGIAVMVGYFVSTVNLFSKIIHKPMTCVSSVSILLAAPSVVAAALSAWMNVLEFLSRRKQAMRATGNDAVAIEQYKRVNGPF